MDVDLRWNHPSTTFIVGPSMSGKSTVVGNILKNVDSLHKTEKGKIKEKILIFRNYQDSYAAWERENLIDTKFAFCIIFKIFLLIFSLIKKHTLGCALSF